MEKLSGLELDIYDDPAGVILKTVFPGAEDLPELVKEAHAITGEERERLPDDAFALVLVQDATGSRDVTWPGSVVWAKGQAPNLTNTGNAIDVATFYFDGTTYYGVANLNFS